MSCIAMMYTHNYVWSTNYSARFKVVAWFIDQYTSTLHQYNLQVCFKHMLSSHSSGMQPDFPFFGKKQVDYTEISPYT